MADKDLVYGRNSVKETMEGSRKIEKLYVLKDGDGLLNKIVASARRGKIPVEVTDRKTLDRLAEGGRHQGIIAKVEPFQYSKVEDIMKLAERRGEDPFLLVLDGIEDPHNLGAILRTAECAGVHGVVIQERRACGVTPTVSKIAAGAAEHVLVAKVVNLSRTIDDLKQRGIWIGCLDMGEGEYFRHNLTGPIALVVGNEGKGIGRLVKEKCDFVISIPMRGNTSSLNASNATAVVAYDVVRQRIISVSPK